MGKARQNIKRRMASLDKALSEQARKGVGAIDAYIQLESEYKRLGERLRPEKGRDGAHENQ